MLLTARAYRPLPVAPSVVCGLAKAASYLGRLCVIATSLGLAVEWERNFGTPWPLPHSFELAPTVEAQLWQSLAISLKMRTIGGYRLPWMR